MYSLEFVIASVGTAAVMGLTIGYLIGGRISPQGRKNHELEAKLDQALQDKKAYEDEVVDHFSTTAGLLNKLTDSYRDVHNHLASGASALCQNQGPVALEKMGGGLTDGEIPAALADIHQPLDYAPKTSPNEPGMLNEEFGIERALKKEAEAKEKSARK